MANPLMSGLGFVDPAATYRQVAGEAQDRNMRQQHADLQTAGVLSSLQQRDRANSLDDVKRAAIATGDIETIRKVDPVLALKITEGGALSDLRKATIGKLTEQTNTVRSQRDAATKVGAQLDPNSAVWAPQPGGMGRPDMVVPSMTDDQARAMDAASGGAPLHIGVPNQGTLAGLAAQMDPRAGSQLLKQMRPAAPVNPMAATKVVSGGYLTPGADGQPIFNPTKVVPPVKPAAGSVATPTPPEGNSPAALKIDVLRYATDGTLPSNMGRGQQGAAQATAIRKGAEDLAKELGVPLEDLRAIQINNKALSTALAQVQRQAGNVLTYEKTALEGAKIALEMSDKVDRTGVPVLNKWVNAGRKNILGDADVTRLNNAVETFTNEYAKVMSGSSGGQATTVSMQQHAREMLSAAMTKDQFSKAVDLMSREMKETRETAFEAQIKDMMGRIKLPNRNPSAAPGPVPTGAVTAPGMRGSDQDLINKYLNPK